MKEDSVRRKAGVKDVRRKGGKEERKEGERCSVRETSKPRKR